MTARATAHPADCPICHATEAFERTRATISGRPIFICGQCSGYFLQPPMRVQYDDSVWSRTRADSWDRDVQRGRGHALRICDAVEPLLGRPVGTALEVGCSSGYMSAGFTDAGCAYVGIDVDAASIEFARGRGIDAHVASMELLDDSPLAGRRFDLVLSSNVFEHFDDPDRAFRVLCRICRGVAVVVVPNPDSLAGLLRASAPVRKALRILERSENELAYSINGTWHNIAYSRKTLAFLCRRVGLTPLRLETMGKNDPVFGFVQPNASRFYRVFSWVAGRLGMDAELLLVARPAVANQPVD